MSFTGFSISPPPGEGWSISLQEFAGIGFRKPLSTRRSQADTFAVAAAVFYPTGGPVVDLRAYVESRARGEGRFTPETIARGEGRFTIVQARVMPDDSLKVECVRIEFVTEERDNPLIPGVVLTITGSGLYCRHPSSPEYLVFLSYSERRPQQEPSRLDDALRNEAEAAWKSVAFVPVPRPELPPGTRVLPPAPDVPPDRANFSGKWSGTFDNGLQVVLLVEEVHADDAVLVFVGGGLSDRPGWERMKAMFRPDGLVYVSPGGTSIIYRPRPDGTLLATVTNRRGKTLQATLTRAAE